MTEDQKIIGLNRNKRASDCILRKPFNHEKSSNIIVSKEVVEFPSLDDFNIHLDKALNNMV